MTARDEAIDAISDWYHQWMYGDNGTNATLSEARRLAEYLVDNIPPGVLARLAIEQGGFERVGWIGPNDTSLDKDEWWLRHEDEASDLIDPQPLYRVVEP